MPHAVKWISKRLAERFTHSCTCEIYLWFELELRLKLKIGLTDRVDQLLTTLTPTPNWCVTSEASVLDIHDMRAYLCHYLSLTGPWFISCEISDVSSCYCSVNRRRSRRCYQQLANLVMTSQTLIVVVLRIIKNLCIVNSLYFPQMEVICSFFFRMWF
jgi:hypothetical protein